MGKRATKVEKEERILRIVRLISNGAVTSDIVAYTREHWGIQRAQAENLLREARKTIIEDINRERSEITAEMIHICQAVIKNGMKTNQLNVVIGAINTVSRLGGLEQAK